MRKTINQRALAIQARFFSALNILLERNENIGGLKGFCKKHHLNRTKYSLLRQSFGADDIGTYKLIDIDAVAALCDYGVNPVWLLQGKGGMFIKEDAPTKQI